MWSMLQINIAQYFFLGSYLLSDISDCQVTFGHGSHSASPRQRLLTLGAKWCNNVTDLQEKRNQSMCWWYSRSTLGFSDKRGDPSHLSCWTSIALFKLSDRKSGKCSNKRQRKRKKKTEVKCYKIKERRHVNSLTLNKKKRNVQSMVLHKAWLHKRKETIWFTACAARSICQM